MNPDLYVARDLVNAGAAAVMPLGAPIGTNRGLQTKEMVRILIEEISLPIVVDAGIGKPSQACEAMEMGAAACLVNTAIATAGDPVRMARPSAKPCAPAQRLPCQGRPGLAGRGVGLLAADRVPRAAMTRGPRHEPPVFRRPAGVAFG